MYLKMPGWKTIGENDMDIIGSIPQMLITDYKSKIIPLHL